ncbi:MAG TPA: hypothetical protein VEL07_10790, partial [Planctomycetota bacterium]|nr:hypothetical protein [Planctomycetota bacterium]
PPIADGWDEEHWKQAQCMRFLAHAATCLTRWHPNGLGAGVRIPPATIAGVTTPDVTVTHQRLLDWHESCLQLVNTFCAHHPYDWAVQRNANRQLGWDYPLIQPDLFAPPAVGPVFGTPCLVGTRQLPAQTAAQWGAVAAQDIKHAGGSYAYPHAAIGQCGLAHDKRRFSLTAPFSASERCRQVVFFSVDWMAYEDAETARSAPVDASKYRKGAPFPKRTFAALCNVRQTWHDTFLLHFRNDEGAYVHVLPVDAYATGADTKGLRYNDVYNHYGMPLTALNGHRPEVVAAGLDAIPDQGLAPKYVAVFNGLYGADRNWNGRLDRGPIPTSVRMRATTLARYNFYDCRVPFKVR